MRPIDSSPSSVNHSAPSGPTAMSRGAGAPKSPGGVPAGTGIVNCSIAPSTVMRPIAPAACSVNHSAPSGPAAIEYGSLEPNVPSPCEGTTSRSTSVPCGVISPTAPASGSVNQTLPSAATAIELGAPSGPRW